MMVLIVVPLEMLLQIEASHIRLYHTCAIIVPSFYWSPSLGLQTARQQHGLFSFIAIAFNEAAPNPHELMKVLALSIV
jgi:hypothetical protein